MAEELANVEEPSYDVSKLEGVEKLQSYYWVCLKKMRRKF